MRDRPIKWPPEEEFPALTFRQNESGDCQIVDCVPVYIPDVGAIIYWLESGNVIKQE